MGIKMNRAQKNVSRTDRELESKGAAMAEAEAEPAAVDLMAGGGY